MLKFQKNEEDIPMRAKATLEDVWVTIREGQKEFQKGQKEFRETQKEIQEAQKENGQQIKGLRQSQAETDRQLKETDRQLKETALQLRRTDRRFNSQWGKLVESLVEGDIVRQFNQKNILVEGTSTRNKKTFKNKQYEFDIIAHNGAEIVVVEVKTTLDTRKVDHFIKKLKEFKIVFPEYASKKLYGAVAYIVSDGGSDRYSERQGLFVIRATGNSSSIVNAENFRPRAF